MVDGVDGTGHRLTCGGWVMGVVAVDDVADGGGMEGVVMVMVVLGVLWLLVDGGFDETALAV